MSLIQEIQNGQIVSDKMNNNSDGTKKTTATDDTKQMFLKLLVTEMQYQDPLQPTDNSEYVKEMATFSQVEAVNSIKSEMTAMQANTLVGQCVTVVDENDKEVTGIVDYVTKDATPQISVEGNLYDLDKIKSVQEPSYYEAVTISQTFTDMVSKLPNVNYVTLSDKSSIEAAAHVYDSMTDYQKTFVADSTVSTLKSLVTRLNEMLKTQEETDEKKKTEEEESKKTSETDETSGTSASSTNSGSTETSGTSENTSTTETTDSTASTDSTSSTPTA